MPIEMNEVKSSNIARVGYDPLEKTMQVQFSSGTLTKLELAERAGYEASGGGFNNALPRLRTLELIEGRADLRASADLF